MVDVSDQAALTVGLTKLFININKVAVTAKSLVVAPSVLPKERLHRLSEVRQHCDVTDCWVVVWDKVYDLTNFIHQHPGGEDLILENAGRDATVQFIEVGHSRDAMHMLNNYCIGMLAEEDRIGTMINRP